MSTIAQNNNKHVLTCDTTAVKCTQKPTPRYFPRLFFFFASIVIVVKSTKSAKSLPMIILIFLRVIESIYPIMSCHHIRWLFELKIIECSKKQQIFYRKISFTPAFRKPVTAATAATAKKKIHKQRSYLVQGVNCAQSQTIC